MIAVQKVAIIHDNFSLEDFLIMRSETGTSWFRVTHLIKWASSTLKYNRKNLLDIRLLGSSPKVVLDNDHLLSLDYEYGNGALEYVKPS